MVTFELIVRLAGGIYCVVMLTLFFGLLLTLGELTQAKKDQIEMKNKVYKRLKGLD